MTAPATSPKRIHGAWYALVALPGITAIIVLATHIPIVIGGLTDLQLQTYRAGVVHEVELKAGEHTIYVEGADDGDTVRPLAMLTCAVNPPSGERLVIEPLRGFESYTVGGFTGVGVFDVIVPSDGRYVVSCSAAESAEAPRFSIGMGFPFMSVVWCLLAMFLALPLTGVVGYVVHRIRNGPRKGARIT